MKMYGIILVGFILVLAEIKLYDRDDYLKNCGTLVYIERILSKKFIINEHMSPNALNFYNKKEIDDFINSSLLDHSKPLFFTENIMDFDSDEDAELYFEVKYKL